MTYQLETAKPDAQRYAEYRDARLEAFKTSLLSPAPVYPEMEEAALTHWMTEAVKTLGASDLPEGKAYYQDLVRFYTTLPEATPESVHAIGLQEVKRIRAEMDAVVAYLQMIGTLVDHQKAKAYEQPR